MPNTIRAAKHVILPDGTGQTVHVTSQSLIDAGLDPTATENDVMSKGHDGPELDEKGNPIEGTNKYYPPVVIKKGYANVPAAWVPMTNGTATQYAVMNKLKGGEMFLKNNNAYPNKVPQFNKASSPNAETLVEQNKNAQPVITTPTGQPVQQAQPVTTKTVEQAKTPKATVVEPKSKAEYDALPKGTQYLKNGVVKIKQ